MTALRTRRFPAHSARRGVMLLAVIVVLAVAALAVGALSVAQQAEHAGQAAAQDRTQQHMIAWSGVQAVAAHLAEQRAALAAGEMPDLPSEIELWSGDGQTAVVRLLPVGPMGELAVSEMAKRALSALTPQELAGTEVVSAELAQAALARWEGADVIEGIVDPQAGLTPTVVLGPVVSTIAEGVRAAHDGDDGDMLAGVARPLALADVVRPFDAQRALHVTASGDILPRVALGEEWTPEGEQAIDQAVGPGVAGQIRQLLEEKPPADEGQLVRALIDVGVDASKWSAVLDAVVCGADAVEVARVDLARAPEAVLRTLPGLDAEKAARLVQERQALTAQERTQLAWPVTRGVLTPEEFVQLAPHITAHGWLWRVRLLSGTTWLFDDFQTLSGVLVWDVVIDLAESPPRLASLRDGTLLPVVAGLAAQAARETPRRRNEEPDPEEADFLEDPGFWEKMPDFFAAGRRTDTSTRRNTERAPRAGSAPSSEPPSEPSADPAPEASPTTSRRAFGTAAKEWESLGDRIAQQRQERMRAEQERRAGNRVQGGWRERPAPPGGGDSQPPEGASEPASGGRSASGTPTASAPAGGLSGRWRVRGATGR